MNLKKNKIKTIVSFGGFGFLLGVSAMAKEPTLAHGLLSPIATLIEYHKDVETPGYLYLIISTLTYVLIGFLLTTKKRLLYTSLFIGISVLVDVWLLFILSRIISP